MIASPEIGLVIAIGPCPAAVNRMFPFGQHLGGRTTAPCPRRTRELLWATPRSTDRVIPTRVQSATQEAGSLRWRSPSGPLSERNLGGDDGSSPALVVGLAEPAAGPRIRRP